MPAAGVIVSLCLWFISSSYEGRFSLRASTRNRNNGLGSLIAAILNPVRRRRARAPRLFVARYCSGAGICAICRWSAGQRRRNATLCCSLLSSCFSVSCETRLFEPVCVASDSYRCVYYDEIKHSSSPNQYPPFYACGVCVCVCVNKSLQKHSFLCYWALISSFLCVCVRACVWVSETESVCACVCVCVCVVCLSEWVCMRAHASEQMSAGTLISV